ncbi:MAG: Crp/Fnr family transcriptional regulator [Bacteroidales bacterium]
MKRDVRMYQADNLYKLLLQDVNDVDISMVDGVKVRKNVYIYDVGDMADNLWYLLYGKVRIGRPTTSGGEVTRAIYTRGNFFGIKAHLFGNKAHDEFSLTTANSLLCKIPLDCVKNGLKHDISFARAFNNIIHERYKKAEHRADILHCSDVQCRVKEFLQYLIPDFGTKFQGGTLINHPYTQNEIAQLLGTSRPTINKVLKELENKGEISFNRKRIVLLE